jgi:hypothetical protein
MPHLSDSTDDPPPLDGPGNPGDPGGPGSGTVIASYVKITHVNDMKGADHYSSMTACAMAIPGQITVIATANPDVQLNGSITGPPTTSPFNPTQYPADSSSDSNGTWTFVCNSNLAVGDGYTINITATAPNNGSDSASLHVVNDYTVNKCANAVGIGAAAGAVVPDPYIEVLYAPAVVVAGQPFWVLVRAEPGSIYDNTHPSAMYPLNCDYTPTLWAAGGSGTTQPGKTICWGPLLPATPLVSLVEFQFPTWVREARLDFFGYSLPYSKIIASVIVEAIR